MIDDGIHRAARPETTATLHEGLFRFASATETANLPAFVAEEKSLSFIDLACRATQLAAYLNENGVGPSDHVVVRGHPSLDRVVAIYAILIAGASYVPVSIGAPLERAHAINRQAAVTTVLGDDDADIERAISSPVMWSLNYADFLNQLPADCAFVQPTYPVPSSQCAYIMFAPYGSVRGMAMAHAAAMNALLDASQRFAVTPADRLLASSDIDCDLSIFDLFMPALTGCAALLGGSGSTDPDASMGEVQGLATALGKATIWAADAALMVQVLDEIAGRAFDMPKRVRHWLARGDWLTSKLTTSLTARLAGAETHLSLMSGASGTALWSSVAGFVVDAASPLTLRPISSMRLHIVDADGRACQPGVVGNLQIAGAGLALGHVNGAEFSTGCFRVDEHLGERLYPTELQARSTTDGAIELIGMNDVAAGGFLQQAKVDTPTPTPTPTTV